MSLWKKKEGEKPAPIKKLQKKGDLEEPGQLKEADKKRKPSEKKQKKQEKPRFKKEKEDSYIMKKNTVMRVLRVIFWIMLILVFCRGLAGILKPDKVSEVSKMIKEFKEEQKELGDSPDEVMSFAQDFAKEYLTYAQSGEADFKERISPYVSKRISNMNGIYSFRNTAKATYVNAYRREEYAPNQYDVFVKADIEYSNKNTETGESMTQSSSCTLKVPVRMSEKGYCIESLPMFVSDSRLDTEYNPSESTFGTETDSKQVVPALTNFLEAYYSQDQEMIHYLLTPDADQSKFIGLDQRYVFQKLDSVKAYLVEENEMVCMLKARIKDALNEEAVYQEFNIRIRKEGDKYYIQDMDSKITGVKNQEVKR